MSGNSSLQFIIRNSTFAIRLRIVAPATGPNPAIQTHPRTFPQHRLVRVPPARDPPSMPGARSHIKNPRGDGSGLRATRSILSRFVRRTTLPGGCFRSSLGRLATLDSDPRLTWRTGRRLEACSVVAGGKSAFGGLAPGYCSSAFQAVSAYGAEADRR